MSHHPEDTFTNDVEAAAAYERLRGMDDYDDRPTAADLADADQGPRKVYDAWARMMEQSRDPAVTQTDGAPAEQPCVCSPVTGPHFDCAQHGPDAAWVEGA